MKIKRYWYDYKNEVFEEFTDNDRSSKDLVYWSDVQKLLKLLKFAEQELKFEVPEPSSESEYDFCVVCNNPEWLHKENCEAVKWQKEVREILESNS